MLCTCSACGPKQIAGVPACSAHWRASVVAVEAIRAGGSPVVASAAALGHLYHLEHRLYPEALRFVPAHTIAVTPERSTACLTECAAIVIGGVMLNPPRTDFARPVRA